MTAVTPAEVAALSVSSLVQVVNLPTQAADTESTWFVEGWSETIGPGAWSITYNVSPAQPYLDIWTIEDPILGQYDAYAIAL